LLEAREPKGQAYLAEINGVVAFVKQTSKESVIRIEAQDISKDEYQLDVQKLQIKDGETVNSGDPMFVNGAGETVKATNAGIVKVENNKLVVIRESENFREYTVPAGLGVLVKEGDLVAVGQSLTEGNLNLTQVFTLRGIEACQDYMIKDVQEIYSSQGQNVNEKHIEIIVRQMFSKVRVTEAGDTELLAGDLLDKSRLAMENERIAANGGKPAEAEQLLMGITKASLSTESFLAAASFQETTRVLIDAAINSKTDYLRGLKENVIIGKLIPAGTGYREDALAEKEAAEAHDLQIAGS
jgi:DNA-directed RNA polymerase subunit beta'